MRRGLGAGPVRVAKTLLILAGPLPDGPVALSLVSPGDDSWLFLPKWCARRTLQEDTTDYAQIICEIFWRRARPAENVGSRFLLDADSKLVTNKKADSRF